MNCKDVLGRLDPFLDGELEMEANLEVTRHLEDCSGCASVFEGERNLIEELRRRVEPPAPVPLRARIAEALDRAQAPASRRAAFRILIPAAAAAALVALFASIFPAGEAAAQGIARQAAQWHDAQPAGAAPVSGTPELVSYFRDRGQPCCLHEDLISGGLKYGYKKACVEKSGIAGAVTCWWTAGCPVSGKRMTHAVFRAPVAPVPPGRLHRFEARGRTILVGYRDGFV
jgi:anti-sigma factor (TIGR02949 family)